MADHDVVAAVSETLEHVLTEGLSVLMPAQPPTAEVVDLLQPVSPNTSTKVTLFLYEIVEEPSARNRPHRTTPAGAPPGSLVQIRKPPMALLLRYMVTPWSGDWQTDQKIIGRVMQVLYDDAIISGPVLRGSLANSSEAIKMTLAPISLEDRARVWYSVQQPYRLSLTYEARVINLDSTKTRTATPVRSMERERGERES